MIGQCWNHPLYAKERFKMNKICITGTGLFTPEEKINNAELVEAFNKYAELYNEEHAEEIKNRTRRKIRATSEGFIDKVSGIQNRFVVNKEGILDPEVMAPRLDERTDEDLSIQAEMAVAAAKDAFAGSNVTADQIDMVIAACSNFQRPYPAIAIEVQNALEIKGSAFDLNVACSSATFAIQMAFDSIRNGHAQKVLIVNPEICSAHLNFRDRDSHFIFGDACTAMVIEKGSVWSGREAFEIVDTKLLTQFSNNIRNNFGFLSKATPSAWGHEDKLFRQNGTKVFKEVVLLVGDLIRSHLKELQIEPQMLRRLWLHQANGAMNQLIARRLMERDLSEEEAPIILGKFANTSSAGSIIAFHHHHANLNSGDLALLCSFGAGYSIGNVVLRKV